MRSVYRPENGRVDLTRQTGTADAPSAQIVKAYEHLRPLAVLFGQEKDWSGVLDGYYAESGTPPDGYFGTGMFQAAVFAGAISGFSGGAAGGGV